MRARRADGEIPTVGPLRPVLRLIAIDDDLGARQQRLLGKGAAEQHVRGARFERPVFHFAVGLFHVEVDPDYLTTNRDRMRYETFRAAGYAIGSGAVESAVSHAVQQRMKRVGMRWRSAGADAMLALRSIYRSTGAWDQFWACRRVA